MSDSPTLDPARARALGWALATGLLAACGARSQPLPGDEGRPEPAATGSGGASAAVSVGAGAGGSSSGTGGACDVDADGFAALACGGTDCDDAHSDIHPGAADFNVTKGPWVITRVMENLPGDSRGSPALAVDGSGAVHVAYGEGGLTYATNRGGVWGAETVDASAWGACALALDAGGAPHIGYPVPGEGLRYATGGRGAWTVETVDASALGPSSLVLGPTGRPHLLYDHPAGAALVSRGATGWNTDFTLDGSADANTLALSSGGQLHGAVALETGLWYFVGPSPDGDWTTQLVEPGSSFASASIALSAAGEARLAFASLGAGAQGLRYGKYEGGFWKSETVVAGVVWSASLAVSPAAAEVLHVAYEQTGIHYATFSSGMWSFWTVRPSGAGPRLVLAPDGSVHIAYSGFDFSVSTFVEHATDRLLAPDGVDQNCDGVDGLDADQDGHASTATGGGDCDDQSALVHPGALDAPGDGVDQNCSGVDGPG